MFYLLSSKAKGLHNCKKATAAVFFDHGKISSAASVIVAQIRAGLAVSDKACALQRVGKGFAVFGDRVTHVILRLLMHPNNPKSGYAQAEKCSPLRFIAMCLYLPPNRACAYQRFDDCKRVFALPECALALRMLALVTILAKRDAAPVVRLLRHA
jgi:hypothetical protein